MLAKENSQSRTSVVPDNTLVKARSKEGSVIALKKGAKIKWVKFTYFIFIYPAFTLFQQANRQCYCLTIDHVFFTDFVVLLLPSKAAFFFFFLHYSLNVLSLCFFCLWHNPFIQHCLYFIFLSLVESFHSTLPLLVFVKHLGIQLSLGEGMIGW